MVCWMLRFAFILGKNLFSTFLNCWHLKCKQNAQWNVLFGQTGILVYMSNALQLEGLSTKKPRTTKFSSKATAVSTHWKSTSEKSFCAQANRFMSIAVWLKRVSRMCLISIFCCCHVLAHIFIKLLQMVFHVTFSLYLSLSVHVYFARLVLRQLYRCTEWTLPKE